MRKLLCLLIVLTVVSLACASLIDVGDKAPDFWLTLPDGATTKLSALLKEGPVLVRFAATG